ncbi:MAG: hypothetical protein P8076_07125 [Gammaproteobacteria bacterium]
MATRNEFALPDMHIDAIEPDGDNLTLMLAQFCVYVSLGGSAQQSKWRQSGTLVFEHAAVEGVLPDGPCTVASGEIHDNRFIYRDRVPLPLDARGEVGCVLTLAGRASPITISAQRIRLVEQGQRRYLEHVADQ